MKYSAYKEVPKLGFSQAKLKRNGDNEVIIDKAL
jgi:hypothetical protein